MFFKTKSFLFELSFDLIRRFLAFSNSHSPNVFHNDLYIFVFIESKRVLLLQASNLGLGYCRVIFWSLEAVLKVINLSFSDYFFTEFLFIVIDNQHLLVLI